MGKTPNGPAKLTNWLPPPLATVIAAETTWAENYMPSGADEVYPVVSKYAEKQYDSLLNHFDNADKKADEHLRFMTAAIGAVIALAASKLVTVGHPGATAVSGIVVLLAFLIAILAKLPTATVFPMTPRDLLAVADLPTKPGKHQIESAIAASYQVAITGMRKAVSWKSSLVKVSMYTFYLSFLVLLWSMLSS
jgi:hypothetical protein